MLLWSDLDDYKVRPLKALITPTGGRIKNLVENGRTFHIVEKKRSLDKALDVCEALSAAERGLSVSDLVRSLRMPAATVHRLLSALKRRGYVRQDDDTARYSLTLKMLDLSFKLLGRSELRLHAYPVLREYVLRTGNRCFLAVPHAGEVTYVWNAGPDEVAMYTAYGKEMPGHCSVYFDPQAKRRLSCLRLVHAKDAASPEPIARHLGPLGAMPALQCTCAPVRDYTGREVARVGVFLHAADDEAFARAHPPAAWELAHHISLRLGHLPAAIAVGA
jgi:predicted transcriptional regulator